MTKKEESKNLINLFLHVNNSKRIRRTGWVKNDIPHPESVAEHTFSLSFITMQLAPLLSDRLNYPLNTTKLIKMAILHDIGEIETGDLVVYKGGDVDEKKMREKEDKERKGIKKIFSQTDKSHLAVTTFDEMLERKTLESKIFWQLDKLDMALQALVYELEHKRRLPEFFETARAHIHDEFLKELLEEIEGERPKV